MTALLKACTATKFLLKSTTKAPKTASETLYPRTSKAGYFPLNQTIEQADSLPTEG